MFANLIGFMLFASSPVLSAVIANTTAQNCGSDEHTCSDGACVRAELVCDNRADCADASDERGCQPGPISLQITIQVMYSNRTNSQFTCRKNQWQCHDGTCIAFDSKCDRVADCPDGSDEVQALCQSLPPSAATDAGTLSAQPPVSWSAPPVSWPAPPASWPAPPPPRPEFSLLTNQERPSQAGSCKLKPQASLEYRCVDANGGTRACQGLVPAGTEVRPECTHFYYSPIPLPVMRCFDGDWNYVARCLPECGRLSGEGTQASGLPWHAVIYKKHGDEYQRICAGSLITNTVVITAAACFWVDHSSAMFKASEYAVAVGKLYQRWDDPKDEAQMSGVAKISLPPRYQGVSAFFQDNIAIVAVQKPFEFNNFVRPVCIDFDVILEKQQLQNHSKGKIAGWWTNDSSLLQVIDIPYVDILECITESSLELRKYITSDKICAGKQPNSSLCRGDLGAGLAFANRERSQERYYLRGVASTGIQSSSGSCHTDDHFELFTQTLKHKAFIESWLTSQLEESTTVETPESKPRVSKCLLPAFPEHGTYVTNATTLNETDEGGSYELVTLTVSCERGYGAQGPSSVKCYNGFWPEKFPNCIEMCPLSPHPSVEYRCVVSDAAVGWRACNDHEPPGTVVSPRCREPLYYSASPLSFMRCNSDARWNYIATCRPDCGRETPSGRDLVIGGMDAKKGELPWHAAVYDKSTRPYMQICGGSLISNDLIISAAHCFWKGKLALPATQFAAAVGKLYRPWNDKMDDAQKSDVKHIYTPPRFRGAEANFQADIAVVVVAHPFEYRSFIRPVCLNFDTNFERRQLQTINKGKVPGWGLTSANGKAAPKLQVVELPYVEVDTCIKKSPTDFTQFITGDKICAGTRKPNTALCRGDSGGGLVFLATDSYIERYYLRGVVSTAPAHNYDACNTATYTTFTQILQHEDFILPYLTEF